jgi:hypothetical protein
MPSSTPLNQPLHLDPLPVTMTDAYLAVLKAAYDYEPQSDDEIAVKENQTLFLLERTDDECVPYDSALAVA